MSRDDGYITGNLFDFSYHQNYNKLGIDLSRQKIRVFPPKVSFTGNVEEDDGATIFFIANKM